jgi:hypothetical protein
MRVKGTFKGQDSLFPSPLTLSLFPNGDKRLVNGAKRLVNGDKSLVNGDKRLVNGDKRLVDGDKRLDDKKSRVNIANCSLLIIPELLTNH